MRERSKFLLASSLEYTIQVMIGLMVRRLLLCILALLPITWSATISSKILVVYDTTFEKAEYSTFFSNLESSGHQITFRSTKETSPALVDYEKKAFDAVFLFAPTSKSECLPQLKQILEKKIEPYHSLIFPYLVQTLQ